MSDTKIRALKCFSDGTISMYVGEIRNVDSTKATSFIAGGLAEAYADPIVPTGTKQITSNGTGIDVAQYADVDVAVPQPEGNIEITENGENIDVSQYATATVNVTV